MIFVALLCILIVFPMPFGALLAAPPCVIVIGAGVIYISLPRLRADPSLWTELQRQLDVFHSMTALTFIYPLYIYGYTSLTGFGQLAFALLSPIIQIIAKNRISRKLTGHDYMKPEVVVFYVELYNALYCSSVLQGTSSWKTTVLIIGTDILQFVLVIFDMMKLLDEMNKLMKRIPREHPLANANFVQIAEQLVNLETKLESSQPKSNYSSGSSVTWQKTMTGVKSTNNLKTESSPSREATMQIKNDPPRKKSGLYLTKPESSRFALHGSRIGPNAKFPSLRNYLHQRAVTWNRGNLLT
ncbi:hypothetical protein PF005_g3174 [Phytophthora fragariae]|uniref:TRP C-terminal domain-containing protein n=1 Tax=Phytophthora fragariae TaxID=53985 RepID=A0A6A4ADZ1_9STRA|nr:hypothetical protein PF011_g2550 [Phytophthora fragariae]KAE9134028.1 hypothetical protein PF007_g3092 [Phytophthora fragariae]KAE9153287.1 hypothetical protein PF006_g2559 [Phytophthora fragariae]KAE9231197.1 hypothetical protein PF005_g3174 [Phytophthora fragariae]KAE9251195.1 hypothetical protein PF004_g2596 [Phytophthora fragariae]